MRWLLVPLSLVACEPAPQCADVSSDCDFLYEPTFDNIHANTLLPSCALGGCHDAATAQAGLDMEEIETAYDSLLDGRVEPGNVNCSTLILKIENDRNGMPPGSPMSESERCVLRKWIDAGAPR